MIYKCRRSSRKAVTMDCKHSKETKCSVQYRNLIPAPVDRTAVSAWLYNYPWIACNKNKPNISMTHVAFESELRSVARSSMHPSPGNWVSIGCILPALPTHLVQELNVGTVVLHSTYHDNTGLDDIYIANN